MRGPFEVIEAEKAPESAKKLVRERLFVARMRAARIRMALQSGVVLSSVAAFAFSCSYLWGAARASGFYEYLSVALSGVSVGSVAKELGLSLLESLPALGIAAVLGSGLVLLWSFSSAIAGLRARKVGRQLFA